MRGSFPVLCAVVVGWLAPVVTRAGELTVDLGRSRGVVLVGALARWDAGGAARTPVNPAARIDAPELTAKAERLSDSRWVFRRLDPGRYDLVVLAAGRVRVEGFHYPPVSEFDPILPPTARIAEDLRDEIVQDIAKTKHYENKVKSLFLAGDDKQVRVLVQLVRDEATTYDAEYGRPAATIRHEVWQYVNRYGGWARDRRTRVLDRLLLPRAELRRWTWVWEPALGGIEVKDRPVTISCELPAKFDPRAARGWLPD